MNNKRRSFIKTMGAACLANSLHVPGLYATENQNSGTQEIQSDSFADFLENYGESNPPEMVYRSEQDFNLWQAAFRGKVGSLRGIVPKRKELKIEIIESREMGGYTRRLVRFPVTDFTNLYAYILIPAGLRKNEKRPGILALHGHGKSGIHGICGIDNDVAAYGLWAVKAGYVVVAPSWWGWYGRDAHLPLVGKGRDKCNVAHMAASMYGINVLDLHIQDGQAAVDVLLSLPETDPDRVGCIGLSYGGRMAMWLSVFDQRIAACVSSGAMNNFRERSLKLSSCAIQFLPGLLKYGDVPEVYSLIAPVPLQLQAGKEDKLITPEDRDNMINIVRNAYINIQAERSFDFVFHEGGHIFDWDSASRFLEQHIKA